MDCRQYTRLPCPSVSPSVCSNSYPLSQWCHPTTPSSVASLPFHPQSFPASGSFWMSRFFASASDLPMNVQGWFSLGLTGLVSLQSKRLSRVFSNTTVRKCSAFFMVQLLHLYMTTRKKHSFDYVDLCVSKVMFLFFNMLSRFTYCYAYDRYSINVCFICC